MRAFFVGVLAIGLASLSPSVASACGGFFCSSSPIDQSSERILYAHEADGSLTMAVEITYSGFDDDFAWILPVLAVPEITVGTSALFDAVDFASRPTFPLDERTEGTCRVHPRCVRSDGSELSAGSCGGDPTWGAETYVETPEDPAPPLVPPPDGTDMMGVTVFSQGPVGPYETVVLGAATAVEVTDWLAAHGYDVPGPARPLLEPYAAAGYLFVALRLSPQSASSVLRPIVLRTPAPEEGEVEACLPIRLTAVASTPTMPITAFFLGDQLVISRNYSLAEPDLSDPRFYRGTATYAAAVAAEADRLGGQAFAVDYAGRMPLLTVSLPSVTDLASETDPAAFVAALVSRGYRGDRLLLELLERGLIPPTGESATTYYNCLATRRTSLCGEPDGFDPAGLAALIDREITRPRAEAEALVRRHLRLTRLSTELSPWEMTLDPVFVRDAGLPEVSNVHPGTLVRRCSDTYFRSDAPVDLDVGGRRSPWAPGTFSSDAAYCNRFGATVADGLVASGAAAECGYGCSIARSDGAPLDGAVLLVLGALGVLAWSARRRRL